MGHSVWLLLGRVSDFDYKPLMTWIDPILIGIRDALFGFAILLWGGVIVGFLAARRRWKREAKERQ